VTEGFYTTVIRAPRKVGYLLGPFDDEPTARAAIPAARRLAEQLARDLRAYRDAADPGPEKSRYRYPLRDIEHAAALIRKAGI